jgi:hypothetical protein
MARRPHRFPDPRLQCSHRSNHFGLLASDRPTKPGASSQIVKVAGWSVRLAPTRGLSTTGVMPHPPEVLDRSDAGQLQQLRCAECACAEDDFATCECDAPSAAALILDM